MFPRLDEDERIDLTADDIALRVEEKGLSRKQRVTRIGLHAALPRTLKEYEAEARATGANRFGRGEPESPSAKKEQAAPPSATAASPSAKKEQAAPASSAAQKEPPEEQSGKEPPPGEDAKHETLPSSGAVRFGGSVTIERDDGRTQTWRIVGEDEADPAAGSVSHVSPLARAVVGRRVGDEVKVAGQSAEIVAVG